MGLISIHNMDPVREAYLETLNNLHSDESLLNYRTIHLCPNWHSQVRKYPTSEEQEEATTTSETNSDLYQKQGP